MKRDTIDKAGLAQFERMVSLLRDVRRSGGFDKWSHLHSHGHKFPTVRSVIRRGYMFETSAYNYALSEVGRQMLDDVEAAARTADRLRA